jgi:hypothetical protein
MARNVMLRLTPLILILLCVLATTTACVGGGDDAAAPTESETWEVTVEFETTSQSDQRTDEFAFGGVAWDGDEHLVPARWTICVEGSQDGCTGADAECTFHGEAESDVGTFEIRCDDHSDEGAVDTPCATIDSVEFCAVAGTVTTDQAQCDDGDFEQGSAPTFCAYGAELNASVITGGQGREFAGSRHDATWELEKREVDRVSSP